MRKYQTATLMYAVMGNNKANFCGMSYCKNKQHLEMHEDAALNLLTLKNKKLGFYVFCTDDFNVVEWW